jgi:putative colanic acid biosynthesis UDP-glucose lipid carrier transferase
LGNLLGHEPGHPIQIRNETTEVSVKSALQDLSFDIATSPQRNDLRPGAGKIQASKTKRIIDVLGASLILFFLAPLLTIIFFAIRLESRGPVIFKQKRTGFRGVSFDIYKFRTMTVIEYDGNVTQVQINDKRTTTLGRFLRRSSIDELPQLINVLRGEMSLVGPRPHAIAHDRFYSSIVEQYYLRFLAKPGMSGLAQVCGSRGPTPTVQDMTERIAFDLDYIHSWSLKLDLEIIIQTIVNCIFSPGAF